MHDIFAMSWRVGSVERYVWIHGVGDVAGRLNPPARILICRRRPSSTGVLYAIDAKFSILMRISAVGGTLSGGGPDVVLEADPLLGPVRQGLRRRIIAISSCTWLGFDGCVSLVPWSWCVCRLCIWSEGFFFGT